MKVKKLALIIPLILLMSTVYGQESNKEKFKKLQWLVGKWIRTNPKAGQSGYETWTKVTDLKLTGEGVTLRGKETIFLENLEFIVKGNDIFYSVMITGEKSPVYFKLTALNANGFTCENPEHDFPKKIAYQRNGKYVKAIISGNGQSMDYNFVAGEQ
ncbi:MAG: DUF6265 family protein [Candidatus Pedobacter colombiensis]|uniref:DUF6265 family protein n=1 Tax=Candidatus Pedobacter colombiensis TaxID=3121371 RepID=A0AAJ5W6J0_9SPHI|nr:DUF6265 family protein [Pedobacter sp.]WEK18470.1 MAG: DUF6265 family protein [Pedobacter sp.]